MKMFLIISAVIMSGISFLMMIAEPRTGTKGLYLLSTIANLIIAVAILALV